MKKLKLRIRKLRRYSLLYKASRARAKAEGFALGVSFALKHSEKDKISFWSMCEFIYNKLKQS